MTIRGRGGLCCGLLFALAVAGGARSAGAQGADPKKAERLFVEGREAAKRGDWLNACPKFRESQALDPKNGTLLNLADCEEHLGHLATAYGFLNQVLKALPANDDRIALVESRLTALTMRVPRLTLVGNLPEDARIELDGSPFSLTFLGRARPVDPGGHVILVHRDGATRRYDVVLGEGEGRELSLTEDGPVVAPTEPRPAGKAPSPSRRSPARPTPPPAGDASRATTGYVLGGIGLVGLGVGTVGGLIAMGKKSEMRDHCDASNACDEAGLDAASSGRTWARVATVSTVLGLAGVGAGAYFLLTDESGGSVGLGGSPIPSGGAVSVRGRFLCAWYALRLSSWRWGASP